MKHTFTFVVILFSITLLSCTPSKKGYHGHHNYGKDEKIPVAPYELLSNERQITFNGRRAGEGYFSHDGKMMVFQSERTLQNPFYQIYVKDFETGKTTQVSNGLGKTTCAWIHPDKKRVMYSSTHLDPQSRKLQKDEIDFRNSGRKKRYSWDYDPNYDIFVTSIKGKKTKRITKAFGYDAEGSYSPDGKWIAFASNRHAYTDKLSPEDEKMLKRNPSYFLDIYIMKADGSEVKRLTTSKGYDGGPFFNAQGDKITWRRFTPDGHTAEVFTMNLDGSEQTQITRIGKMSWAPFYHPSGDYVIFNTNKHGYGNFELYIVDSLGKQKPKRVTFKAGFDGLPVFLPNGQQMAWTRKEKDGTSQIYLADWNDALARKLLDLPPAKATLNPSLFQAEISEKDIRRSVYYLASPEMKGRMTGSLEELKYTAALTKFFQAKGLSPLNGKYSHVFEFNAGIEYGKNNDLKIKRLSKDSLKLDSDWLPLPFSKSGQFSAKNIVFVGYGIVAPKSNGFQAYNSYQGLDVKGKWVLSFRYLPEEIDNKKRQHLHQYSRLFHKVMMARERGAKGIILVNGPLAPGKKSLVEISKKQASYGKSSLPVISISNDLAVRLFKENGFNLKDLQAKLDKEQEVKKAELKHTYLNVNIDLKENLKKARNTFALLKVPGAKNTIVIGAHGDHLGHGKVENSLMKSTDKTDIHFGADDNASGVAGVIELADLFANKNPKNLKKNILFAVWSGEELGTLGSQAFVKKYKKQLNISSYLNMDMIGRFEKKFSIQGTGSSKDWPEILERISHLNKVPVSLQEDPYLPTDSMPFYLAGIPTLSFFTGSHEDYHSPRDTADKLNYPKMVDEIEIVGRIAHNLASKSKKIRYNKVDRKNSGKSPSRGFRVILGTIPDYTNKSAKGMKLSGVIKGGPAEKAGLQGGDIIVNLDTFKIENIYDYVYALQAIKPNKATKVTVLRENNKIDLQIVPKLKE